MDSHLSVRNLYKNFGDVRALRGVSFDVARGEFFTLLGPSGCGKTTLLRCIAGFENPDAGEIRVLGANISAVPPERRDIGFVFQSYALFPTMTVAENVAFGLEMRKHDKPETARRVAAVLELVGLSGMEDRKPRQLSGGQQQRVALARAMVIEPNILVLDEPLSNLDARLRLEMRTELRRLQKRSGITAIYVTHDQDEAFSLSDRIVVMSDGEIQQIGTPQELYYNPRNGFVARFIGQANLIEGRCTGTSNGALIVEGMGQRLEAQATPGIGEGVAVLVSIRAEHLVIGLDGSLRNAIPGLIRQVEFLGSAVRFHVACGGHELIAEQMGVSQSEAETMPSEGAEVYLSFDPADARCLPADG